jgi:hypothetical protein
VKHNRTADFKAQRFSGTQAQWEETLSAILLGAAETEFTRGVEAVAKIETDVEITIIIQKRIEGITVRSMQAFMVYHKLIFHQQRLGTISVPANTKANVDLYEWCGLTIQSKQDASRELADLRGKLRQKDEETNKLNHTLAELVNLKNAHEDDLLQKFSTLLNEKKLKIRDQQRLLANANVDPEKLEEIERNRIPERDSPPGPSRRRKRKAATVAKDKEDDDTDEGYEKMDVDAAEPEKDLDEEDRRTEDEQSTVDEDEDDEAAVQMPTRSNTKTSAPEPEIQEPPPKRELPFEKKPIPSPSKPAPDDEGSETESDDEL